MTTRNATPDLPRLPAGSPDGRILIVDDEPANTTILRRLLDQAGYAQLTIINDSRQAIEAYERVEPDLVLLDLHMPGVDGFTILGALIEAATPGRRPPVIVLTADATRTARERALRMGAADFITKPLDHLEVLLRIRNQLATRFLQLELLARNVDLEATVDERTVALRESLDRLQQTSEERQALAAALVNAQELERRREQEQRDRLALVRRALEPGGIHPVFQPIVDLATGHTVGFEALSRFTVEPLAPPDAWFQMAAGVGLLEELELAAIRLAVASIERLPAGTYLSLNISPDTAHSPDFERAFHGLSAERTVLEITEHAEVPDYLALQDALTPFRQRGARLAVDDAGAGFASLRHILHLQPDIIKLDISITRSVDVDRPRRALASALASFGEEMGIELVAEGIETKAELEALRALGVHYGQGYFLGRPAPEPTIPPWPAG